MHIYLALVVKEATSSVQEILVLAERLFMSTQATESNRSEDDQLHCTQLKKKKKTTKLGLQLAVLEQFSEQLSTRFSGVRSKATQLGATTCTSTKEEDAFHFLRLSFPLDSFRKSEVVTSTTCSVAETRGSDAILNLGLSLQTLTNFMLPKKPHLSTEHGQKDLNVEGPSQNHFLGFFLHVNPERKATEVEPDQRNNNLFLNVIVHDVSKALGLEKSGRLGFARVREGKAPSLEEHLFDVGREMIHKPLFKLPNIETLKTSALATSLSEIVDLFPQLRKASQNYPDKRKLSSVQDFFKYTETEGRKLFEELDRDKDGQVTIDDLELAMRKRRLPQRYAKEFLQRTKKHWLKKSFGWSEFLCLMEQKEPVMLRAFNSLSVTKSGTLQKGQVLTLLHNAGLPATEGNAAAMMRFLDADTEGSITYGQFRNFLLLLPPERLGDDPRMVWFEAATVVPIAPPVEIHAGSVLKSALAGGLSCALSTSLMYPLDTLKTRIQASTLSFPDLISTLPKLGRRGLYRGSIPAIVGQFSSHGLRTGIFEASKMVMYNISPHVSELQVQSVASFCSTFLGTALRIPCEVLKQRLQAGLYSNVGEAIVGTMKQDGWRGFFRGTGATLCREVPFYVAGMMIYEEAKKVVQKVIRRELVAWETIAIGGLSGGLAAVFTTPFDVMKTRMMTAAPGVPISMSAVVVRIVSEEGMMALFKGAVPRFFWIAPLGAMNFAGYELAKRAMEKEASK